MLVTFDIWLFHNHMSYRTDSLVAWRFISSVIILLILHSNILCQSIIIFLMSDKTFITGETYLVNVYLAIDSSFSLCGPLYR